MADMLRYDEGTVESVELDYDRLRHFRAVVDCKEYTKDRWNSFGLVTRVL